ncbi:MAG: DUF771 domain-containing protein [Streptococcaceae bacterium]|nr:DUF771 domain-containing protein [Streptococcaceae bacterium]MCH4176222.1 DUF771 domain-containing protein [Streptococcaceae bacterium]
MEGLENLFTPAQLDAIKFLIQENKEVEKASVTWTKKEFEKQSGYSWAVWNTRVFSNPTLEKRLNIDKDPIHGWVRFSKGGGSKTIVWAEKAAEFIKNEMPEYIK